MTDVIFIISLINVVMCVLCMLAMKDKERMILPLLFCVVMVVMMWIIK